MRAANVRREIRLALPSSFPTNDIANLALDDFQSVWRRCCSLQLKLQWQRLDYKQQRALVKCGWLNGRTTLHFTQGKLLCRKRPPKLTSCLLGDHSFGKRMARRCNAVSASASPSPSSSDWLIVSASRRAPKWRTDRNYEWAQWIWAGRKAGKPPKWIDLSHLKVNLMSVKLVSWKISWHRKTTHQSLNQEFVIMTGEYAHVAQFGFVFFDDDCRRRVFFRRCQ